MVTGRLAWRLRVWQGLALASALGIATVLAVPFVEQFRAEAVADALVARFERVRERLRAATRDGPVASCDRLQALLETGETEPWRIEDIGFQLLPGAQQGAYRPLLTVCAAATDPAARSAVIAARVRFRTLGEISAPVSPRDTVTSYGVGLSPPGRVACLGHPTLPPRPCAGVPPLPGRSEASRQMLQPG